MRTVTKVLFALGIAGTAALANPAPSQAGYYIYTAPGVRVYVDTPRRHHYRPRYYNGYAYAPRYRGYYYGRSGKASNGCPPHYTVQDGRCKPYRGY